MDQTNQPVNSGFSGNGMPQGGISAEYAHAETTDFVNRVFAWMGAGLAITAAVAYYVSSSKAIMSVVLGNIAVFFGLIVLEFLAVLFLSVLSARLNSTESAIVFILYSLMNGVTLSAIFLVYSISSIGTVFLTTAATFIIVAVYGFSTKRDLTSVGHLAFMGLIGILVAWLINAFFRNDMMSFVIACVSVLVFVGLIAYDTQKIKALNAISAIGSEAEKKSAIQGALVLYLDFINLFLSLLRLMGKRK